MKVIELDMYQATAVAAIVLLLGRILVDKIAILRKYCIPGTGSRWIYLCDSAPGCKKRWNS